MNRNLKKVLTGSIKVNSHIFNWGYLLFRIYAGISIALGAGLSKVFHKIDEKGGENWDNLAFGAGKWFVEQVADIGFTFISPKFWAYIAVYGEFIGGLFIALGIFTRLSSMQLAFQFFIVAFVWFEHPVPFVGMYYQQLIFWSFVMTFAAGDGKYSLATLIATIKKSKPTIKLAAVIGVILFSTSTSKAQSEAARVSFTIKNHTLKSRNIEFKSYDSKTERFTAGYGYGLSGVSSHAVNLPASVYVFERRKGKKELIFVVKPEDNGKSYAVNQTYKITREQYLKAARAEMNQRNFEKTKDENSISAIAIKKDIKVVGVSIKSTSWLPSLVYVRYELPWTKDDQVGFSSTLTRFSGKYVFLPIGTKIYQCDDKYWEKNTEYNETLLLAIDGDKSEYTVYLK